MADVLETEWLIWSNEHNAWWRASWNGYTRFINEAGHYSFQEAIEIWSRRRRIRREEPSSWKLA